mmetsp:Transcript_29702/g.60678  ORF Transcript_29702/g.60678 Transcript_29702/m.60678 type:complete len:250 (-) Transcript_29702:24-773(-)
MGPILITRPPVQNGVDGFLAGTVDVVPPHVPNEREHPFREARDGIGPILVVDLDVGRVRPAVFRRALTEFLGASHVLVALAGLHESGAIGVGGEVRNDGDEGLVADDLHLVLGGGGVFLLLRLLLLIDVDQAPPRDRRLSRKEVTPPFVALVHPAQTAVFESLEPDRLLRSVSQFVREPPARLRPLALLLRLLDGIFPGPTGVVPGGQEPRPYDPIHDLIFVLVVVYQVRGTAHPVHGVQVDPFVVRPN